VLLHEAGATVLHLVRSAAVRFGSPWTARSNGASWHQLRKPVSKIGPGWKSVCCVRLPWAYRFLPERVRVRTVRTHLGPEGGWFMKERARSIPVLAGHRLRDADVSSGRVVLRVVAADGSEQQLSADHVIAATGYRPDVRRLDLLSPLAHQVRVEDMYPQLSANFESSIGGLYFIGPIAAAAFGPVMRFAVGADFTTRRLSAHLARGAESPAAAVPTAPRMAVNR